MFVNRRDMFPPFSWCFRSNVDDGFAVVSEYFGRGLFNKVTVVTEPPTPSADVPSIQPKQTNIQTNLQTNVQTNLQNYGPGAEAKLRLQEGQSKQMFVSNATKQMAPKGTSVVPVPEGRMRVLEQQQYSSSLEANMTRLEPRVHPISIPKEQSPKLSPNISSAITSNPFEDTYDETKNPFADEESSDPANPFSEDDDYDKNLNPFA
ncbi:unnamed protein product [Colias eurytheme]|nr:unnamed protein product [Colias eurytheme]